LEENAIEVIKEMISILEQAKRVLESGYTLSSVEVIQIDSAYHEVSFINFD